MSQALGRLLLVVVGAGALGAAFAAGRLTRPAASVSQPSPDETLALERARRELEQARALAALTSSAARPGLSADELRATLREELAHLRNDEPPAEAAEPRRDEPPRPVAQTPQFRKGVNLIDSAIQDHTWTPAHKEKLHLLFLNMDSAQKEELAIKLASSINAGEIHVDIEEGGPF
jgi:hypothetical protein